MIYDLLIRGGRVVDGTGAPAERLDVAIVDGRIAALEPAIESAASTVIKATIVAGEITRREGQDTGARPGRLLRNRPLVVG